MQNTQLLNDTEYISDIISNNISFKDLLLTTCTEKNINANKISFTTNKNINLNNNLEFLQKN